MLGSIGVDVRRHPDEQLAAFELGVANGAVVGIGHTLQDVLGGSAQTLREHCQAALRFLQCLKRGTACSELALKFVGSRLHRRNSRFDVLVQQLLDGVRVYIVCDERKL